MAKVWKPVSESLEYDLTTHAIKYGEIPKPYCVCRLVDVPDAAPLDMPDEVRSIIALWRNDYAARSEAFLSLNPRNAQGLKYQMEITVIDAWLDSVSAQP